LQSESKAVSIFVLMESWLLFDRRVMTVSEAMVGLGGDKLTTRAWKVELAVLNLL
jgi:hypothetical protein